MPRPGELLVATATFAELSWSVTVEELKDGSSVETGARRPMAVPCRRRVLVRQSPPSGAGCCFLGIIWIYVALRQIRQRNEGGKGMAIAGIVLGWVGIAGAILITILIIVGSHTHNCYYGVNGNLECR